MATIHVEFGIREARAVTSLLGRRTEVGLTEDQRKAFVKIHTALLIHDTKTTDENTTRKTQTSRKRSPRID